MNEQGYLTAWGTYVIAGLGLTLVFWLMTGWIRRRLRESLRLIAFILLFTSTLVDSQNDLYALAITIAALDAVLKVGNNAWRVVSDLALVALPGFGLYLLIAATRWSPERAWKDRWHPPQDAEDEPTLRQMMQPELMLDVDTRTDEHSDRRTHIEPCLQPSATRSVLALYPAGVQYETRPTSGFPMDCVSCAIAGGREPAHRLFEDEHSIVLLDIFPLRPAHVLIVACEHAPHLSDLSTAARDALPAPVERTGRALRRAGLGVEGINLLLNDGVAVNQHAAHLHLYLIPRRRGDLPRLL